MSENSGPLEEIEFWKNRCSDLSGISSQLDKPGVKKISHILELAKSSYTAPFTKLSGQIKVGGCLQFEVIAKRELGRCTVYLSGQIKSVKLEKSLAVQNKDNNLFLQ